MKLLVIAVLTALMLPAAAQAWTPPTNLGPGSPPVVLDTKVVFNGPFDTMFGAFGSDKLYIGTKGDRVQVATAGKFRAVGPRTGGARVAAAPGAAVFSTFEKGDVGNVYLVQGGKTRKLSARGHIRSVAVATHGTDTLVAWDLRGTIQARLNGGPVKDIAHVNRAMRMSVALKDKHHSLIAWVDEGTTNRIQESVNLGKATTLETDPVAPSGEGVAVAYAGKLPIVAWSGHDAVRAKVGDAVQDVAPIGPSENYLAYGLGDVAVSGDQALISMGAETGQVYASVLQNNAFGSAEPVGAPAGTLYGRTSAGFVNGVATVAWSAGGNVFTSTR